ncbi:MAG: hypothetical protein OXB99_00150 [Acidimicrobiaceae bacterium]|nr:hypothetical protein [Acidimicrobiaceae bacterium]
MASPTSPVEPTDKEGEGLLETIGAQLATLATQISEIDQRMASVESGSPSQPVEVQLSPETVAQIADALAELQAAGSQALDEAFKTASDDLTEALSGLVRTEISRTLTDAGYTVEVSDASEAPEVSDIGEVADFDELDEPAVDDAALAMPVAVAPLATSPAATAEQPETVPDVIDAVPIRDAVDDLEDDEEGLEASSDGPPLALSELDDPFLDALIRKEPLSA